MDSSAHLRVLALGKESKYCDVSALPGLDEKRKKPEWIAVMILISCTAADQWSRVCFSGFLLFYLWPNDFYTEFVRIFISAVGFKSASGRRRELCEVSLSSLVDVLLQVEKSRWMTAALFGPVGNQTNNPIMLPAQIWRAARQWLCAI